MQPDLTYQRPRNRHRSVNTTRTGPGRSAAVFWLLLALWCQLSAFTVPATATDNLPPAARMALVEADRLTDNGKIVDAVRLLKTFQSGGSPAWQPGDPDPRGRHHHLIAFSIGSGYLRLEQPLKAIPFFTAAVTARPNFYAGWMNLAKCCYDTRQYRKAGTYFVKAYDTAGEKKASTLYYGAICFMTAEAFPESRQIFERLLAAHPGEIQSEWKERLVQVYLTVEQPGKALPLIEQLTDATDGDRQRQWREVLLHQYLSLGMKKKALGFVERLVTAEPLEPRWWQGLAHLHLAENRFREALTALTVKGWLAPLTDREMRTAADLNMALGHSDPGRRPLWQASGKPSDRRNPAQDRRVLSAPSPTGRSAPLGADVSGKDRHRFPADDAQRGTALRTGALSGSGGSFRNSGPASGSCRPRMADDGICGLAGRRFGSRPPGVGERRKIQSRKSIGPKNAAAARSAAVPEPVKHSPDPGFFLFGIFPPVGRQFDRGEKPLPKGNHPFTAFRLPPVRQTKTKSPSSDNA